MHTPYDIMVGIWFGTFAIFSKNGRWLAGGASRYLTYWKTRPTLMHFRQDAELRAKGLLGEPGEENQIKTLFGLRVFEALRALAIAEYDLTVSGKHATAIGPIDVSAAETIPDIYHFELKEKSTDLRWYNTHIFPSPNERRTIGPVVRSDELGLIMVHNFTRIAYDVPDELHKELTR